MRVNENNGAFVLYVGYGSIALFGGQILGSKAGS